jgi:hypothetical protein
VRVVLGMCFEPQATAVQGCACVANTASDVRDVRVTLWKRAGRWIEWSLFQGTGGVEGVKKGLAVAMVRWRYGHANAG